MQSVNSTKQEKKPLSVKGIEAMKPDQIKTDTGENGGLRVKCAKSGVKAFSYRYRSPITGKLKQVAMGHFPDTTLNQARIKLHELKVIRKSGRCPATEKKQQEKEAAVAKQLAESTSNFTIQAMVELYLTHYIEDRTVNEEFIKGARNPKGQAETRRTLYSDVVRRLGDKQACKVTRKEAGSLINEIIDRNSRVQAGNVLREFIAAYDFAISKEKFDDDFANPALLAKSLMKFTVKSLTAIPGDRYFEDDEIRTFLKWLPGSAYTQTQKNILRFTLWTGCRTGEVCNAEWKDINLEKGIWHLSMTKNGKPRTVQLPRQAVEYLQQLKLSTGDYPFPSIKTGMPIQQKSLTEQAWHMRRSGRMLVLERKWTPHDLRRTVRTGLARLKCSNDIAEAILGHSKSGIEATYNHYKYEEGCREWLQKWADHLDSLI